MTRKKTTTRKHGWPNPRKEVEHGTSGKCKECHKYVENLEAHMQSKHRKVGDTKRMKR